MEYTTIIEIRAIAAGGKFLGNDIGGAEIVVRDAATGELVAHQRVRGGSGDTQQIMGVQRFWGTPVPTQQSSEMTVKLELREPRLLDITAYGPLGSLQSARRASVQQWVVPGMDLTGPRGVQVVIPGQLVEIVDPVTHTQLSAPGLVSIRANVAMMCGCPITESTPDAKAVWPQEDFTVAAFVYRLPQDGPAELVANLPMDYAGTASQFHTTWEMATPGFYEIVVGAIQNASSNTGVDRTTVFCPPPSPG